MEDRTEREIALYDLLKQVLCNYIVRQRITYHQALAACVPVLGFQLWLMRETQDEVPPLIEHAVTTLHGQQSSYTHRPLPPFADYRANREDPAARALATALVTLLRDSAVEHHLSVAATWRTFLPLFAEVLAMARVDAGGHQWDIDGFIDGLREQLPPWIDYWESWAGQGHASGQEEAR
jgi:hypothetical protein